MALVYIGFVPHPPIVVPEIGRGEEKHCQYTLNAYRQISQRVLDTHPDTVVLISPHAPLSQAGMTVLTDDPLTGDFANFGLPLPKFEFANDPNLVRSLEKGLSPLYLVRARLDHGSLVPLYFLREAGWNGRVVVLGMPLRNPEEYGKRLGEILEEQPGQYAIMASGDLSHRLREDSPYGLHPSGPVFDQAVVNTLKRDRTKIAEIDPHIVDEAGECGYRSLRAALAAKEGAVQVLSYEGPFGVGYMVAELYYSSPIPKWARRCLTEYLKGNNPMDLPIPTDSEFQLRRACFVTLKTKNGELRGCIGTTEPWQHNLALEIAHNAIAAGTQDPRFWPVELDELDLIKFSVDVLGDLEKVDGYEDLDPWYYGVLVRSRGRSGLLLPHLEGIDTVEQQVGIAKQKAGLKDDEPVELWRFEVVRYFE